MRLKMCCHGVFCRRDDDFSGKIEIWSYSISSQLCGMGRVTNFEIGNTAASRDPKVIRVCISTSSLCTGRIFFLCTFNLFLFRSILISLFRRDNFLGESESIELYKVRWRTRIAILCTHFPSRLRHSPHVVHFATLVCHAIAVTIAGTTKSIFSSMWDDEIPNKKTKWHIYNWMHAYNKMPIMIISEILAFRTLHSCFENKPE